MNNPTGYVDPSGYAMRWMLPYELREGGQSFLDLPGTYTSVDSPYFFMAHQAHLERLYGMYYNWLKKLAAEEAKKAKEAADKKSAASTPMPNVDRNDGQAVMAGDAGEAVGASSLDMVGAGTNDASPEAGIKKGVFPFSNSRGMDCGIALIQNIESLLGLPVSSTEQILAAMGKSKSDIIKGGDGLSLARDIAPYLASEDVLVTQQITHSDQESSNVITGNSLVIGNREISMQVLSMGEVVTFNPSVGHVYLMSVNAAGGVDLYNGPDVASHGKPQVVISLKEAVGLHTTTSTKLSGNLWVVTRVK